MPSLFTAVGEPGTVYEAIRSSDSAAERETREHAERLWSVFRPHADPHFLSEFRKQTHARFWEMYLSCVLLEAGHVVECRKRGPDVLLRTNDRRVWIEAVTASEGDPASPDRVTGFNKGAYPEEQILLRYRSAIDEKRRKLQRYVDTGIVEPADSYVIAVNRGGMPCAFLDREPPDIAKAVLPIGAHQLHVRRSDMEVLREDFAYRSELTKSSGSTVTTDIFMHPEYAGISAVLFSATNISNRPPIPGSEFVLVHNPLAAVPLPDGHLGVGTEYRVSVAGPDFVLAKVDTPA